MVRLPIGAKQLTTTFLLAVLLRLKCAHKSPEKLVKIQHLS